jgi:Rad3-related DNA helicase
VKKALQAAGRPSRTLEDKAAMVFLDYRFSTSYCQQFFPPWIRDNLKILPKEEKQFHWSFVTFSEEFIE